MEDVIQLCVIFPYRTARTGSYRCYLIKVTAVRCLFPKLEINICLSSCSGFVPGSNIFRLSLNWSKFTLVLLEGVEHTIAWISFPFLTVSYREKPLFLGTSTFWRVLEGSSFFVGVIESTTQTIKTAAEFLLLSSDQFSALVIFLKGCHMGCFLSH